MFFRNLRPGDPCFHYKLRSRTKFSRGHLFFFAVNLTNVSLRKQPTFGDALPVSLTWDQALLFFFWLLWLEREKTDYRDKGRGRGFPAKWRLRNERRNSILMTRHYPDLGSASDWSCRVGNLIQPIRRTTQIWVVTRHQYGISAVMSKTSFRGKKPVVASRKVGRFSGHNK